jgi:hypothetical protein
VRAIKLSLLTGVVLAGPALSQGQGPSCAALASGIALCLPDSWAQIANPDGASSAMRLRAEPLQAEVWHIWPVPKDDGTAKMLVDHQDYLRDLLMAGPSSPRVAPATCKGCDATVSVMTEIDGAQTFLATVRLPASAIGITVTSLAARLSPEDLAKSEALVAGITVDWPTYDKAFGHGN